MKQFVSETDSILLNQKKLSKKRVLCSFSGGQDSTIAFFALFHRKILSGETINLLYFHHFWQIQNFQASKGIFHLSFNLKVPYTIIISNISLVNENRSRNWRRKKLFRFYNVQQTSIVVTGHTQTDKLETNLNNLIRGTSSKGISSLKKFRGFREAYCNMSQNSTSACFCSIVFSSSFVAFRLLIQPKQIMFVKKSRVKSKILFSTTNLFSEKTVSHLLQRQFFKKFNLATYKSQTFNHYKCQMDKTIFKSKVKDVFNKKKLRCYPQKIFFVSQSLFQKRSFWYKMDNKSNRLWFWKQKEIHLSQNLQKNNFFYTFLRTHVSITKSKSFCFSKFSEKRQIILKTPIKNQTRIIVSKVAKSYSLPVFQDLTNFSHHSSRNKIRHIMFPIIGYLFQKKVDFSFTQFFSTLRDDNYECENKSQKFYFLIDFFSRPSICYSNLVNNSKNFAVQKTVFLRLEMLGDWVVFRKQNELGAFDNFLLLYVYQNTERNFYPYIIKKIIRNYTERELSFQQIKNIQKFLRHQEKFF